MIVTVFLVALGIVGGALELTLPRGPAATAEAREADQLLGSARGDAARGLPLFAQRCASCHGAIGGGDGAAAALLFPKPRNFTAGEFRLTSTQSGLPSDADLRHVIEEGMPGSAMPPWRHLPSGDVDDLVAAVKFLSIEGKIASLMAESGLDEEQARALATGTLVAGPPVHLPARSTPKSRHTVHSSPYSIASSISQ
jgi:mono/diheme cytochrome c family protein